MVCELFFVKRKFSFWKEKVTIFEVIDWTDRNFYRLSFIILEKLCFQGKFSPRYTQNCQYRLSIFYYTVSGCRSNVEIRVARESTEIRWVVQCLLNSFALLQSYHTPSVHDGTSNFICESINKFSNWSLK